MLQNFKNHLGAGLRNAMAIAGILVLAGCASTLSARVTTYEQWPANAQGQTYHIASTAVQINNLEYQSFADMIRASMGQTGLVEAPAGSKARFSVSFEYGNPVTQVWVQQYNDPYFTGGFGPMFGPWGNYYGGYHGYGGWGGGIFFTPSVVNVPVELHKNTLTVLIKDNDRKGAEVYRSSAVSLTSSDNILAVMPYLARAVFDGFPGNNGQVRDITYERER